MTVCVEPSFRLDDFFTSRNGAVHVRQYQKPGNVINPHSRCRIKAHCSRNVVDLFEMSDQEA